MKLEENKKLIESLVPHKQTSPIIILLLVALVGIVSTLGTSFFTQKGQNLATKQDISGITSTVEEIKASVQNSQEIEKQKRELKYKAILTSLNIIDAYISHLKVLDKSLGKISQQSVSIEEIRSCHSNLILTCDNPEIVRKFTQILFNPKEPNGLLKDNFIDLLIEYRNLVRLELGFGQPIYSDTITTWIGSTSFEK
jgi:hypothetical protein